MPPPTFMEKLKKKIKNREQEKEEIDKLEATSEQNSKRKKSAKPKSKNKSKQTGKKDNKDRKKGAGKDTDRQVSEEESHEESAKGANNKKKKPPAPGAKVNVMTKAPNADKEVADWTEKVLQKGLLLLCADFEKLKTWQPPNRDATAFNAPQNADKNRSKDLPCLDVSRVRLKDDAYIHANYVGTAKSEKQFICTQAPLEHTVETFWRMVVEERSKAIVMLCDFSEDGQRKCPNYYPTKPDQTLTFGDITVRCAPKEHKLLSEEAQEVTTTELFVSTPQTPKPMHVVHVCWTSWAGDAVPQPDLTAMGILRAVRGADTPVVVHCIDGASRTGTFVLVEFLLQRMIAGLPFMESSEAVQQLRQQRAGCVGNDMQYAYAHRVLIDYFVKRKKVDMTQTLLEFRDDYDAMYRKYEKAPAAKDGAQTGGGGSPTTMQIGTGNGVTAFGGPTGGVTAFGGPTGGVTAFGGPMGAVTAFGGASTPPNGNNQPPPPPPSIYFAP